MMNKTPPDGGKSFAVFLASQGISNLGDAFHMVAAVSLLVNITGSGLSAAFGLAVSPAVSILFSIPAGFLSDIRHEKTILIILDLLRGLVALLFISGREVYEIYLFITALSVLEPFYGPPRRKLIANLLSAERLMAGNSLLNGISGAMYIVGPVLAGIIIGKFGTDTAFLLNSISFFASAFIIAAIRDTGRRRNPGSAGYFISEGFYYCVRIEAVRKLVLLGTLVCFTTAAVNLAFYPLAFDILKVSHLQWGMMMSVFYGSNVIAMSIVLAAGLKAGSFYWSIPYLLAAISAIWFSYGFTVSFIPLLLLQLIEGTVLSLVNTLVAAGLQLTSGKDILGRVVGTSEFIGNIGRIIGTAGAYGAMKSATPKHIFIICSIMLLLYSFSAKPFAVHPPSKKQAAIPQR